MTGRRLVQSDIGNTIVIIIFIIIVIVILAMAVVMVAVQYFAMNLWAEISLCSCCSLMSGPGHR